MPPSEVPNDTLGRETISVIMPCFNAAAHIAASLSSVLGQTYRDVELIVVNDGSTDGSLDVLENIQHPRLRIINQQNRGVSVARNRGVAAATGAYIAFLDADDQWHPDCLEQLHGALQAEPDAALAYCGWQNMGLPGGRGQPYVPPEYEGPQKLEYLLTSCPWPIHAVLTRKGAIEEVGNFDERFSNAEDYGLWLKIASFHRIVRVPEVLAFYHFHEGIQASKHMAKAALDHWQVQQEFLKEHPEVGRQLGRRRIRQLTLGGLLKSGYICYWERDLTGARRIFRLVMKNGYGGLNDWKYMLPALLPLSVQDALIRLREGNEAAAT